MVKVIWTVGVLILWIEIVQRILRIIFPFANIYQDFLNMLNEIILMSKLIQCMFVLKKQKKKIKQMNWARPISFFKVCSFFFFFHSKNNYLLVILMNEDNRVSSGSNYCVEEFFSRCGERSRNYILEVVAACLSSLNDFLAVCWANLTRHSGR